MLGLSDIWISSAFLLSIFSALLCVVYGLINWNRGGERPTEKDLQWEQENEKLEETL